jgi:hypothetical protein
MAHLPKPPKVSGKSDARKNLLILIESMGLPVVRQSIGPPRVRKFTQRNDGDRRSARAPA